MPNDMRDSLPKCTTGYNPSGLCSCCRVDGRKCCIGCKDRNNCNIVCGWLPDEKERESDG